MRDISYNVTDVSHWLGPYLDLSLQEHPHLKFTNITAADDLGSMVPTAMVSTLFSLNILASGPDWLKY